MMIVVAPAKLNLTLEVQGKRADGYHEIKSVIQTINFCDTLKFSKSSRLEFQCNRPDWSPERSLVSKAAELLRRTAPSSPGALIELTKRIPMSGGLGGDSSDAVAVLRGLNMLWQLRLSLPDLLKLAAQLGSDLPLFLHGGTVLAEGRGERITPLPAMPHASAVLLVSPLTAGEGKTGQMYARLRSRDFTDGKKTEELVAALSANQNNSDRIVEGLFNVFDRVGMSFFAGLRKAFDKFAAAGAKEIHLAGSGPTLFSLMRDEVEATRIHHQLQAQGLESYLTDF